MQYGNHGRDLILELKRTEGNGLTEATTLPAYNNVSVRSALQELSLHIQALKDQAEASAKLDGDSPDMKLRPSLLLQDAAIQRNKRCLLAYHRVRMDRVKELNYWQSQPPIEKNMCPAEIDFLADYEMLIQKYQEKVGITFDIRSRMVPPQPFDRAHVRVISDQFSNGPIVLESGETPVLLKGSTHNLLYTDIEEYLRSGDLEILPEEEQ